VLRRRAAAPGRFRPRNGRDNGIAMFSPPTKFRSALRRRTHGFTFIELMIAVVIVGALAAVALPSFLDQIRKSRRAEAISTLATLQQAQERFRSNNATRAMAC
jgi:prepilin-type N-terminal cleavage/methylation domain-containing protein